MKFLVWGLVTMAVLTGAVLAASSRAGSSENCDPPGPPIGRKEVQTSKHGAVAVTEYGPGGSYRKTLCNQHDKVLTSVHSAPFPFAHGVVKYLPIAVTTKTPGTADAYATKFITYRSPLIRGWNHAFSKDASATIGRVLPPGNQSELNTPSAASLRASFRKMRSSAVHKLSSRVTGNTCTDRTFGVYVPEVFPTRGILYYTAVGSYPAGGITSRSVRRGAYAWNKTINNCGLGDQSNVLGSRMGDTNSRAQSVDDGINVVDFGDTDEIGCGGITTLACTFIFFNGGIRTGFDMRLSNAQHWVNGAKRGGFDVQSVATHEMGHALIGLNDISGEEHDNLTMYEAGETDDIRGRDLALGDVLGMRVQYPKNVDLSTHR